jgi:hypothetical protein
MRARTLVLFVVVAACAEDRGPAPSPLLKREQLADRFPHWKALFQRYLAIDTTNPPGNERQTFDLLQGSLTELGLTSSVAAIGPDRGNVWARLAATSPDPGARPIVLLHHIDVVPAERDKWTQDAFSGVEKNGRIYGRGAIDIKHLGIVQLAALWPASPCATSFSLVTRFCVVATTTMSRSFMNERIAKPPSSSRYSGFHSSRLRSTASCAPRPSASSSETAR